MGTIRQEIKKILEKGPVTAKEISSILGIKEKEVIYHIPHVSRSLPKNEKLIIDPPQCRLCGFIFKGRKKISKPSRCPRCYAGSIQPSAFWIKRSNKK